MWIISPVIGLLSISLADDPEAGRPSANVLMIRARRRRHLELLKERHAVLANVAIQKSKPGLDYPYRLVVDRATLVVVFREMAEQIAWRNVKGEAHRNESDLGSDFVSAMHEVHGTLARIRGEPASDAEA